MDKFVFNVNRCCCFFDVLTGTKILVILGLIGSIWQLVSTLGDLMSIESTYKGEAPTVAIIIVRLLSYYSMIHWIVFGIIPCGLGVNAVFNNKPSYLKPYIFVTIFEMLTICTFCPVFLLMAITSGEFLRKVFSELMSTPDHIVRPPSVSEIVNLVLFVILILLAINWYFVSVVYKCYKVMKEGRTLGVQYSTATLENNAYLRT